MLTNAFSLNMLPANFAGTIEVVPCSFNTARQALAAGGSAVGHEDTAAVFSSILNVNVPTVRRTVVLENDQLVVVGQYRGPRLPVGATELPVGATVEFMRVTVHSY